MKKIYFIAASLLVSASMFAQTNLSFENWTGATPDGWSFNANVLAGVGTLNATPVTQGTTNPSDGLSYLVSESVTLSGSTNGQVPDGVYGGFAYANAWQSTDLYESVSFDVRHAVLATDSAVVAIFGYDSEGDVQAQGYTLVGGSQATWTTVVVDVVYFETSIVEWDMVVSSSASSIFNGTGTTAVEGSILEVDNIVLGALLNPAPNVTDVVATDISDNGNGTDLEVSFTVPADETNILNYYAVAFATGVSPAMAVDPLALVTGAGIEVTPDGSNQVVNFGAADVYVGLNAAQTAFEVNPIVEDVSMTVYIYVVGDNGYLDVWAPSNEITLTSAGTSGINENTISVNAYPNPANSELNITMSENATSVAVISMDGKVVASQEVNGTSTTINVANLNSGVYFYEVTAENGLVVRNSFVKN